MSKTSKLVKSAIQVEDIENYNAHPYQKLPVIKKYKNGNTLENLKWGLIPSWAKNKDFKALINARLETIDEKISFKRLIKLLSWGDNNSGSNEQVGEIGGLSFCILSGPNNTSDILLAISVLCSLILFPRAFKKQMRFSWSFIQ